MLKSCSMSEITLTLGALARGEKQAAEKPAALGLLKEIDLAETTPVGRIIPAPQTIRMRSDLPEFNGKKFQLFQNKPAEKKWRMSQTSGQAPKLLPKHGKHEASMKR